MAKQIQDEIDEFGLPEPRESNTMRGQIVHYLHSAMESGLSFGGGAGKTFSVNLLESRPKYGIIGLDSQTAISNSIPIALRMTSAAEARQEI